MQENVAQAETNTTAPSSQKSGRPLVLAIGAVAVLALCSAGGYAIYQYFSSLSPIVMLESATSYEECMRLEKSIVTVGKPSTCTTESGDIYEEYIPPTVIVETSANGIESFETTNTEVPNPQLAKVKEYSLDVQTCVVGTTLSSELTTSKSTETIAILSNNDIDCVIAYKRTNEVDQSVCTVPKNVEKLTFTTTPFGGFHIAPLSAYCK